MAYDKILIPVDGSVDSLYACDVAISMAKQDGGDDTVYLVHCVEAIPNIIGGEGREKIIAGYNKLAEQIFALYTAKLNASGIKYETLITYGNFGQEVLKLTKKMNVDIVIMGTRGRSSLKGFLLGSVSSTILEHSEIPVILACKRTGFN